MEKMKKGGGMWEKGLEEDGRMLRNVGEGIGRRWKNVEECGRRK